MKRYLTTITTISIATIIVAASVFYVTNAQEFVGQKYDYLVFEWLSTLEVDPGVARINAPRIVNEELNHTLSEAVSNGSGDLAAYLDALGEIGWQLKSSTLVDGIGILFIFERPQ